MVSTLIANPSDPSLRVTTQALHWTAGGPPRRESLCENSAIQKDGSSPANSQVRKGGFHPSGAAPLGWKPPFLTCKLPYDLLGFRTVSVARSANRMFEVDLVARPSH